MEKKFKTILLIVLILLLNPFAQTINSSFKNFDLYLFQDSRYHSSWVGTEDVLELGTVITKQLDSEGIDYQIANSGTLVRVMSDMDSAPDTIVVMLNTILPELVWNGKKDSLVVRWIKAGGTLVWQGDLEFVYVAFSNGTWSDTEEGLRVLYGVDWMQHDFEYLNVVPTKTGVDFIPSFTMFQSVRPTNRNQLFGYNYTAFGIASYGNTEYYDPVKINIGKGSIIRICMTPGNLVKPEKRGILMSELIINYLYKDIEESIPVEESPSGDFTTKLFKIFSSRSLETLAGIFSISVGSIGIYSWVKKSRNEKRLEQVLFKTYMMEIDDVYKKFKMNSRECEAELYKVKEEIIDEFKDGKMQANNYNFLEKRIEDYMNEIKEQIYKEKENI
jgi:hypothetical protein